MTSPTIPLHAARLWLEDNSIYLDLPAIGSDVSHRLTFPNDGYGLTRLLYLLQQRTKQSLIAEEGDITQHQLNRKIRDMKAKVKVDAAGERITKVKSKDSFSSTARAGARDVLRRLGLT